MSDQDIRMVIKQAIAKVTKIDPVTINDYATFREDLGLDSLSILETIVEVECRFKIADMTNEITPEEYATLSNVAEVSRFIQQRLCVEVG